MILPISCACGQNRWFLPVGFEFNGKIDTSCCITTLRVTLDFVEFSV